MNSSYPLISVIIPVYNGCKYLSEAIESVLCQTYPHLEIILIDDGSTDQTSTVASCYKEKVSYFYQDNQGPGLARNKGIKEAKGDYFAFLDADDLYCRSKLLSQFNFLLHFPLFDLVLSHLQLVKDNLDFVSYSFASFSFGAALIKRKVFDQIGKCSFDFFYGEDVDWFLRVRDQGIKIGFLPQIGLLYRVHQANMTKNHACNQHYFLKALHHSIKRRKN